MIDLLTNRFSFRSTLLLASCLPATPIAVPDRGATSQPTGEAGATRATPEVAATQPAAGWATYRDDTAGFEWSW